MLKLNFVFSVFFGLFLNATSCSKTPLDSKNIELAFTAEEQHLIKQTNLFAFDLFKNVVSDSGMRENVLLSPVSISMALSMANNGAVNETKESINKTLRFNGFSERELNRYYHKLLESLPLIDSETSFEIANSIWYRKGFEVLPTFSAINKEYFQATVEGLDFTGAESLERINSWVDNQSHGKIPSIIDEIPSDVVMYLINAIYFKSNWQEEFDVSKTRKLPFNKADGTSIQVSFMNNQKDFDAFITDDITGIELPYHDNKFSMIVMMPTNGKSSVVMIGLLSDSLRFKALFQGIQKRRIDLFLPKFKVSYSNNLNDELASLGMGIAFTDRADFSALSAAGDLLISEVRHKSFIEVDEKGTEAAAVTSVGVSLTSMPIVQEMKFDKPFVFLIREKSTGLILFTGLVNDPSQHVN